MSPLVRERYELLAEAGRGGQGAVIRALDVVHGRHVALKARELPSEQERTALLEEARILFSVRPHPNLPLLREDFIAGDRYYLVMDWIDGRDLRQALREEGAPGLPFDRVLDYLSQAAEALDHLHGHEPPVVHRDVKPANLILTSGGRVVLVDFGISRHRQDLRPPAAGTPDYAAPEANAGAAGPASDVFSLAATAYALLTGAPPRPDVRPLLRGLPDGGSRVMQALRHGLAIDPARRPASATALVEGLRAAASEATQPGIVGSVRRRAWLAGAVVTIGVAVAAGFVAASRDGSPARVASRPTGRLIPVGDGLASCPEGYLCVWADPGYRGGGVGIFGRERSWRAFPEQFALTAQRGSSFYNHGVPAPRDPAPDVRIFSAEGFGGEAVCIPNGGTIEDAAGTPFDDRVLSNLWVRHC